ncbi:MAG: hypothetical protein WBZ11_08120 [Candidatus Sulfotelmatobacter sp.]|jgi:hypothetical protein
MTPKQVERLEKTLGRAAREQGLDQERLRRWVSFLALCGVLESAAEKGVIDIYYLKGGVAMELRFARGVPRPRTRGGGANFRGEKYPSVSTGDDHPSGVAY